jgi:hypothetical protein
MGLSSDTFAAQRDRRHDGARPQLERPAPASAWQRPKTLPLDQGDASLHTDALKKSTRGDNVMIKMSGSVCIDAPAAAVWDRLARIEDIKLWAEPVRRVTCEGASRGVGAQRRCELTGNVVIEERWTAWEEGHSFRYEGSGIPLVKRAANTWSVMPHNAEQTLLTTEAELELKGGWLGRLLEPLMAFAMRRMAPNSLAAFKYLVENGRPYEGPHSALPRAAVSC